MTEPRSTAGSPAGPGGGLTDPMLLMFFGGLMFLMSWMCVAWASWWERHVAPVWEGSEGEVLAEAG